jgi:hypothetical protein
MVPGAGLWSPTWPKAAVPLWSSLTLPRMKPDGGAPAGRIRQRERGGQQRLRVAVVDESAAGAGGVRLGDLWAFLRVVGDRRSCHVRPAEQPTDVGGGGLDARPSSAQDLPTRHCHGSS